MPQSMNSSAADPADELAHLLAVVAEVQRRLACSDATRPLGPREREQRRRWECVYDEAFNALFRPAGPWYVDDDQPARSARQSAR